MSMIGQSMIYAGIIPLLMGVAYCGVFMAWEAVRDRSWRDVMAPGLVGLGAAISVVGAVMQLEW